MGRGLERVLITVFAREVHGGGPQRVAGAQAGGLVGGLLLRMDSNHSYMLASRDAHAGAPWTFHPASRASVPGHLQDDRCTHCRR